MRLDKLVTMLWNHYDDLAKRLDQDKVTLTPEEFDRRKVAATEVKAFTQRVQRFSLGTPVKQNIKTVDDALAFNNAEMVNGEVVLTK